MKDFLPRLSEEGWRSSETHGWLKNKIKDNYLRVPSMGACCPKKKSRGEHTADIPQLEI